MKKLELHKSATSSDKVTNQHVDLLQLASDVASDFRGKLSSSKISVSVQIDQPVKLYTDPNLVKILIYNVIDNAIQFHDHFKDHRWIKIEGNVSYTSCLINITDNGVGLDEKQQANIFNLYYQLSDKSHGLGLGLYISRAIAEKMGGAVLVDSQPGQGLKCIILLPNHEMK